MSSLELSHLDDGDLLRIIDEELSAGEAAQLEAHVAGCQVCHSRLTELRATLDGYTQYREIIAKHAAPPPRPWPDLRSSFAEIDHSLVAPRRLPRRSFAVRPVHWLAIAASLIVVLLLTRKFERVPAVSAAELLRKAAAAESGFPPERRIRVKTRKAVFSRPAVAAHASENLQPLFDAAGFSWQNPLSARSYAAWHDALSDKQDSVDTGASQNDPAGVYVIKTSTAVNPLRSATLTLRARDLRPVREMLEFTTETVEITEEPSGVVNAAAPPAGRATGPPEPAPSLDSSVLNRKLAVFAALHLIQADLGQPVDIRQAGSRLIVNGTGLTAAQGDRLRSALAPIPGVEVHLDEARPQSQGPAQRIETVGPDTSAVQQRLQTMLGDQASAEKFINHALDNSDAVMARVHALRALARAFPPDVETLLTDRDRASLAALRDDHAAALDKCIEETERTLSAVTNSIPSVAKPAPVSWQVAIDPLFASAQRFDETLNAVLTGADTGGQTNGFASVAAALGDLRSQFAAFQKTISANSVRSR